MKVLRRLFPLVAILLTVAACDMGSGPEDAAIGFMEAFSSGEIEQAMTYMSSEINVMGRDKVKGMLQMTYNQAQRDGLLDEDLRFEATEVVENENSATVTIESYEDGELTETQEFELVKEDGEWKISMGDMDDK